MAAELDPSQTAAILSDLMGKFGMSIEGAKTIIDLLAKSSRTAVMSVNNIKDGIEKMEHEVKKGTKSYKDLSRDLNYYKTQIDELTDSTERSTAMAKLDVLSMQARNDILRDGAKKAAGVIIAGTYDYIKQQAKIGVKGLLGDGSPIQLAADLQTAAIDSTANTVVGLAGVGKSVGTALMAIPHPAAVLTGALISLGSSLIEWGAKEAAELAKFKIDVVSKELEKSYKSFQQATAAGALFAGGMTELREVAGRAGLTQTQFTNVIANSSVALAQFGGDVTNGAKKLGNVVGEFSKGTRSELLKLGVSVEDQTQGVADYMEMLQQTGSLRGKTDSELAAGSKEYMINLKAISSFTGEDVKRASARARDAAMQGAVAAKLAKMGPEATTKFQNAIRTLSPVLQQAAMQMFVTGTATGEAAVALSQMPAMAELLGKSLSDVSDSSVSTDTALDNYQNNVKTLGPLLKEQGEAAAGALGLASLMVGKFTEATKIAVEGMNLGNKALGLGTKTTRETATDLANSPDVLLSGVVKGVADLQSLQVEMQKMMTQSITEFADEVPKILERMAEKLRKLGLLEDAPETKAVKKQAKDFSNEKPGLRTESGMDFTAGNFADGGISVGPLSGYRPLLHGTEAVIPLPDGKTVPVSIDSPTPSAVVDTSSNMMRDLLSRQLDLMQKTFDQTTEMLSSFNDSKQLQQQLVHNSY